MLGNITIGQYFPGESPVHRLDPRTKLVITFAFVVLVFLVRSIAGYAAVFLFIAATAALSRLPVRYLIKGLRPLLYIILFTFVINLFLTGGEPVVITWGGRSVPLTWRFLRITREGVRMSVTMVFRLVFLILGTQLLTLTTSPLTMTDAIEQLLGPLKRIRFPVHELAMMMTIAMRFIPTLLQETDRIMKAQMSRGADFESGNIVRRARNMVPLLVPLFVSAFRRADELALAMESRCYRGGQGRTRMKVLAMTRLDLYAGIAALLLTAAVIADNVWGGRLP
ncbi:MAG: energy-coupling factor transporter transmembrane component T family protein [Christensenellales bacterium]|jgi:energy-coupling factor transport system permease protein